MERGKVFVTLSGAKGACLESCPLRSAQGDSLWLASYTIFGRRKNRSSPVPASGFSTSTPITPLFG
jgi:hypothetical protein